MVCDGRLYGELLHSVGKYLNSLLTIHVEVETSYVSCVFVAVFNQGRCRLVWKRHNTKLKVMKSQGTPLIRHS